MQVYDCLLDMYPGFGVYIEDRLLQAALQQIRRTKDTQLQKVLCETYTMMSDVPPEIRREIEWHACQDIREL